MNCEVLSHQSEAAVPAISILCQALEQHMFLFVLCSLNDISGLLLLLYTKLTLKSRFFFEAHPSPKPRFIVIIGGFLVYLYVK